ncbi:MAG TPA: ArsR family transcriptional regulator [Chloroflexi bacterium]|nr:ArsR family transcriptional regulator [Chloroflexota bacterium]
MLAKDLARLAIMAVLAEVDEAEFSFLLRQTGLTKGNLVSHLRVLEEAGFIFTRKVPVGSRKRTLISLTNLGRDTFAAYWRRMLRWSQHFADKPPQTDAPSTDD